MNSAFVNCAEKLITPQNVQTHLNQTCMNVKNKSMKFAICSSSKSNIMIRNFSTGNLNVFF